MKDMKVLLVDDEEEFVKALAERLKMRDLRSDTVLDGEEALSYVEDQEPDVMVLILHIGEGLLAVKDGIGAQIPHQIGRAHV